MRLSVAPVAFALMVAGCSSVQYPFAGAKAPLTLDDQMRRDYVSAMGPVEDALTAILCTSTRLEESHATEAEVSKAAMPLMAHVAIVLSSALDELSRVNWPTSVSGVHELRSLGLPNMIHLARSGQGRLLLDMSEISLSDNLARDSLRLPAVDTLEVGKPFSTTQCSVGQTVSTPSSTPAAQTTTTLDPNADFPDLNVASAANIWLGDLPAGWRLHSHYTGGGQSASDSIRQAYVACLHVADRTVSLDFLPHDFEQFSDTSGGGVMSTVTLFATTADARASFNAVAGPLAPSCKAATMRAVFLTHGRGEVVTGTFLPTGLAGHATMIRETVIDPNSSSSTHEDFLFAEKGPAFVSMDIQSTALDTNAEVTLLHKTLENLQSLHVTDSP